MRNEVVNFRDRSKEPYHYGMHWTGHKYSFRVMPDFPRFQMVILMSGISSEAFSRCNPRSTPSYSSFGLRSMTLRIPGSKNFSRRNLQDGTHIPGWKLFRGGPGEGNPGFGGNLFRGKKCLRRPTFVRARKSYFLAVHISTAPRF